MKKIVHFTADWCHPCKKLKPIIDQYVIENPEVEYVMVDVDTEFHRAEEYNVLSVPTLVIFTDGEVTNRHTGFATREQVEKLLS